MVTKAKATGATGDQQVLARVLKEAIKSGKYTVGSKEVLSELKTAKMVVAASATRGSAILDGRLVREAEKNKVPVVRIDRSSTQLGKMVGKPFRVSAVALRAVAEGDYRQLVASQPQTAKAAE